MLLCMGETALEFVYFISDVLDVLRYGHGWIFVLIVLCHWLTHSIYVEFTFEFPDMNLHSPINLVDVLQMDYRHFAATHEPG